MEIGIFHLHVTVVMLFLILLLFKTVVLLFNRNNFLNKFRAKTKVLDIILGVLILITGIYLLVITGETEFYLIVKIAVVLAAIPLGIIGIKRGNKALAVLSLILFFYIYGVAETKSYKFKRDKFELEAHKNVLTNEAEPGNILNHNMEASLRNGKVIYKVLCIECHGEDGKKGLFKSADLSESQLSKDQKIQIIKEGKGIMRGYEKELSEDEIETVAAYLETLK